MTREEDMTKYEDQVVAAASALKRGDDANWELARLTYENTLSPGRVASQADKVSMEQWCADIRTQSGRKFAVATGADYKAVWKRFGLAGTRDQLAFSDAYAMVNQRAETVEEARSKLDGNRGRQAIRNMPSERKAEVARELLAEPEVAEKVVNDNTARDNVRRALDERYDRAPKPYPVAPASDPPLELVTEFRRTHIAMKRAVELVIERDYQISDAEREALLAEVRWLRNALDYIESGLAAGSLDKALAALLDGER